MINLIQQFTSNHPFISFGIVLFIIIVFFLIVFESNAPHNDIED